MEIDKNLSDWIKVICALLIMLTHYGGYALSKPELNSTINYLMSGGITYIGPVSIFFFLSGYGLMKAEIKTHRSIKSFLKHRISKIYLPVVLVSIIWLPVYAIYIDNSTFTDTSFDQIIYSVTIKFLDGALWFIQSLLLLYLAFLIFAQLSRQNTYISIIVLFILTIGVQFITHKYIAPFASYSVMMFFIGAIGARFSTYRYKTFNLVTILLLLYCGIGYLIYGSYILVCNCFVLLLLNYLTIYLSKPVKKIPLCPAILVALSFDIYLTHYKLIIFMGSDALQNININFITYFFTAIAIAFIFYIIRTHLFRIGMRPQPKCC